MIDLQAPVDIINLDEVLLVHRVDRTFVKDGKFVQKNFEPYELVANVQPMNGRDLLMVPEADRYREQYWVFTEQNEKVPALNDIVVRAQVNFQVQSVENWGSYSKFRMMRVDVGYAATP